MISLYAYKARGALSVVCLATSFSIILGGYVSRLHQQVVELQERLSSLKRLEVRSQEAAALIKTHEKEFAEFEACEFERTLPSDGLQSLRAYTIEVSPPSLINDASSKNLVVREVMVSIFCLQDREVFSLLDQLITRGPGLFHIHDITIRRVSPLSEEILEKIATGKPQALFEGKITGTWTHH
jgi:hypothetical protein